MEIDLNHIHFENWSFLITNLVKIIELFPLFRKKFP